MSRSVQAKEEGLIKGLDSAFRVAIKEFREGHTCSDAAPIIRSTAESSQLRGVTAMSRRATRQPQALSAQELAILRECVRFVVGERGEPFKSELMEALKRGHDCRRERIMRTFANFRRTNPGVV